MNQRILLSLISLLLSATAYAQMDDKFYRPSHEWHPIDSLDYEDIYLEVEEDTLHTIFLSPEGNPKATILFFQGAGGNISRYVHLTRPLVEDGFQVFMVNFRGYGKSTGTPTHLNIARDGQQVLNTLLNREEVRGSKVMLYGASMGTQIATKLAKENADRVDALILDGTISSFTDIAADSSPEEQRAMIRQYVTSPYAAKEDVKALAGMPKLFIHSRRDESVPYAQGRLVFDNAPEPKVFHEYEGNHIDALTLDRAAVLAEINQLLP